MTPTTRAKRDIQTARDLAGAEPLILSGIVGRLTDLPPAPGRVDVVGEDLAIGLPSIGLVAQKVAGGVIYQPLKKVPARLLIDFMALADAPAEDVAKFAHNWGPLGLCRSHGLPAPHLASCDDRFVYDARSLSWRERIKDWRSWARRFGVIHAAVLALRSDEDPVAVDLDFLLPDLPTVKTRFLGTWVVVQAAVNMWGKYCQLQPFVSLTHAEKPEIRIGNLGNAQLFSVLVGQLLADIMGGTVWAACAACGKVHHRKRRPQEGRQTYCETCGKRAANRDAARRWRTARKVTRKKTVPRGKGARRGAQTRKR